MHYDRQGNQRGVKKSGTGKKVTPFNNANSNTPNFFIADSTGKLKSTTAEKKYQSPDEKNRKILLLPLLYHPLVCRQHSVVIKILLYCCLQRRALFTFHN